LIDSLRSGASRLAGDLAAVESEMGELYDAAGGRAGEQGGLQLTTSPPPSPPPAAMPASPVPSLVEQSFAAAAAPVAAQQGYNGAGQPVASPALHEPAVTFELESDEAVLVEEVAPSPTPGTNQDLDGARLVALNMALNGDSRETTGRYLAENFEVGDSERLLNEVYAAIEG